MDVEGGGESGSESGGGEFPGGLSSGGASLLPLLDELAAEDEDVSSGTSELEDSLLLLRPELGSAFSAESEAGRVLGLGVLELTQRGKRWAREGRG